MNRFRIMIWAFCALPFWGIGFYETAQNIREANNSVYIRGIVIRNSYIETFGDSGVSGAYLPQVEYFLPNGERKVFTDKIGSLPPDYEIGAAVEVTYNPENPSSPRINSWKRIWLIPIIFIVVGAVFLIISVG